MPSSTQLDIRPIVRAIEDLRKTVEKTFGKPKSSIAKVRYTVHLAFMQPGDPKPTCWEKSGIGRKFTITSIPEAVTCEECLQLMKDSK